MLSLIVPVFNEENAIAECVRSLHATLSALEEPWEILVINDGSTDRTRTILRGLRLSGVRVISQSENRGNGATIKTGIAHARGDVLGTVDADGTYPIHDFPHLLRVLRQSDAAMVVGARNPLSFPIMHRAAKTILTTVAEILTGRSIPDLNSGMRLFQRSLAGRFAHLSPNRFSFHITLTIASLMSDVPVSFVPIAYGKRIGESKLSHGSGGVYHFLKFLLLIPVITLRNRREKAPLHALPSKSLVHSAP